MEGLGAVRVNYGAAVDRTSPNPSMHKEGRKQDVSFPPGKVARSAGWVLNALYSIPLDTQLQLL